MWSAKLTDAQRDALRALVAGQGEVGPCLAGALEALELARWDDLPEAELPWERVSELARAQGIGEADVFWDLAARKGASVVSSGATGKGRTAPDGGKRPPARRRSR